jgi:hypothetical protein
MYKTKAFSEEPLIILLIALMVLSPGLYKVISSIVGAIF